MLFEIGAELFHHGFVDKAPYVGGAQLALGLAFVLRVGYLYGNYRGYALAHVVARKLDVFLNDIELFTHIVYYLCKRRLEPVEVGSAVGLADIVREGENLLVIAVVVLDCYFEELVVALGFFEIHGLCKQHFLAPVYIFDKVNDASFIAEYVGTLSALALVRKREGKPLIEVGKFAEKRFHVRSAQPRQPAYRKAR